MKIGCRVYLLMVGCFFLCNSLSMSEEVASPADKFTVIMLKAQICDRKIKDLIKDKIVVGVIYDAADMKSKTFADQVNNDISALQSVVKIGDQKSVAAVEFSLPSPFDKEKLVEQLRQNNISVAVMAMTNKNLVQSAVESTRLMQISSFCNYPNCSDNGVAFEIIERDKKPKMLFNLDLAKQEGSDYTANFLTLCEHVK